MEMSGERTIQRRITARLQWMNNPNWGSKRAMQAKIRTSCHRFPRRILRRHRWNMSRNGAAGRKHAVTFLSTCKVYCCVILLRNELQKLLGVVQNGDVEFSTVWIDVIDHD